VPKDDGKVDLVPLFGWIPNACDDMRGGTYEGLIIGSCTSWFFIFSLSTTMNFQFC
jgi:hypothetical protein